MAKKKPLRLRPEVIIMLSIFVCISHQVYFDYHSHVEGNVVLKGDKDFIICEDQDIEAMINGQTKMLYTSDIVCYSEILDSNMNSLCRLSVINERNNYTKIGDNKILKSYYLNNHEGQILIEVENDECEVNYSWITVNNKEYLVVCALSGNMKKEAFISNLFLYIAIGLCFAMIFITIYWQLREVCNRYKQVCTEVSEELSN